VALDVLLFLLVVTRWLEWLALPVNGWMASPSSLRGEIAKDENSLQNLAIHIDFAYT
jgi:hypothetical protein